jgi:hypothetical protein
MSILNNNIYNLKDKTPEEELSLAKIQRMLLDSFGLFPTSNYGYANQTKQLLIDRANNWIKSSALNYWADSAGADAGYIRKIHQCLTNKHNDGSIDKSLIRTAIHKLHLKI